MKHIKQFTNYKLYENMAFEMSYDEWLKTAETEKTIQVNRETIRDIYQLPDGTYVYEHWVSPYNFLKKSYSYTIVDLTLEITEKNENLVKKYKGIINPNWGYSEDGYGLPEFNGDDSLELAFNFVKNEKNNLILHYQEDLPEPERKYEAIPSNIPSDKIYTKSDVTLVSNGSKNNQKIYSIKTKDDKFYTKYDHSGYSYWYDNANGHKLGDHAYDYVFAFPDGIEDAIEKLNKLIK